MLVREVSLKYIINSAVHFVGCLHILDKQYHNVGDRTPSSPGDETQNRMKNYHA
jgi:hypothetical protein